MNEEKKYQEIIIFCHCKSNGRHYFNHNNTKGECVGMISLYILCNMIRKEQSKQ